MEIPTAVSPLLFILGVAAPVDLHKRHPRFDQPATENAVLAEDRASVAIAHRFGFRFEIERCFCRSRGEQSKRFLTDVVVAFDFACRFHRALPFIEFGEQRTSRTETLIGNVRERFDGGGDFETLLECKTIKTKRVVSRSQCTGKLAAQVGTTHFTVRTDARERRPFGGTFSRKIRNQRTHTRPDTAGERNASGGLRTVGAAGERDGPSLVMVLHVVGHAADDRELPRMSGSHRQQFADLHAGACRRDRRVTPAYFRRCIGLGIPSLVMTRSAPQPEQQDRFHFAVRRGGSHGIAEQVRQRESECRASPQLQQLTARDSGAGF